MLIQRFNTAKSLILEVGHELRQFFLRHDLIDFSFKEAKEIVTKADKLSNEQIINSLRELYPQDTFFSEEGEKLYSKTMWLIDPLDGTTNFTLGLHFWDISIAYVNNNVPVFGIVYAPMLDMLFYAYKGKGAYLWNERLEIKNTDPHIVPITFRFGYHVDSTGQLGCNYSLECNKRDIRCRQLGATALELAFVAYNKLSGMVVMGANSYDIVAGTLIVQESGGVVNNLNKKIWKFGEPNLFAGSQKAWEEVSRLITL